MTTLDFEKTGVDTAAAFAIIGYEQGKFDNSIKCPGGAGGMAG
jgi:hypothetical protein